ncbi:hypothetical protein Tmar_0676 [Thermaerobacter marianensis DSM 12885]|uniref:Uncharacterized protein n=1 Tax=Thermaerobacter marianensis (strain ATCC 700841 / DSM 12885 / JCM 10246 / 7p75a) TaxID=644966 RepID=E6SHU6_THEM7|nr:hypothetical protein [Thermaerobacter marianensis]ADU50793.1 hypothetical protein Tmar_0676 [Thermaerobacter marianensis DSM 12885]
MTRIEATGAVNMLAMAGFLLVRYLAEARTATVGAQGLTDTAQLFGWAVPLGLVLFGVAWGGYAIGRAAARSDR